MRSLELEQVLIPYPLSIQVTDDIEAGATSGGMIDTEAYTKLEKKLEQVQADLLKTRSDVDAVVAVSFTAAFCEILANVGCDTLSAAAFSS